MTWPTPYSWPQRTGRPRERWRVSDHPARVVLDANAIRRQYRKAGPQQEPGRLSVEYADGGGAMRNATIAIETLPHAIYGRRWFLRCPRCGSRRIKLYVTRTGPACRRCHRLAY